VIMKLEKNGVSLRLICKREVHIKFVKWLRSKI